MIEILEFRVKSLREKISPDEIQKGEYLNQGFIFLLQEFLNEINKIQELPQNLYPRIRKILAELTQLEILPSQAAWPRRYFYEMAYQRWYEEPRERFIFKALDALYRKKGFEGGWNDPLLKNDIKKEVEESFKKFYTIRASEGWYGDISKEKQSIDSNQAALELGKLFIRLFYVEGLAAELLEAWKEYEIFVYMSNPHYRDHFLHLIYDFLIGCRLIEGLLERIHKNWRDYSGEDISLDELRIRVMRSWLIATLFHDIGYAAQALGRFREKLQETFFAKVPGFELSSLALNKAEYLKEEIGEFLTLLSFMFTEDEFSFTFKQLKEFQEKRDYPERLIFGAINSLLCDQLNKLDHGVISALFLLLTLKIDIHEFTMDENKGLLREERFNKYKKERTEALEDAIAAALAIAIHNMRQEVYKGLTMDFRSHPISFLLMLCDDIHQWDREPDQKRTTEAFRAIYGFNVFQKLKHPKELFEDNIDIRTIDGETLKINSFFFFLKDRVKAIDGQKVNLVSKINNLIPQLKRIANSYQESERVQFEMEKWIDQQETTDHKTKNILKTLLFILTDDVITLTYVGGDEAKRGEKEDRIAELWGTFYNLFFKNLSWGPAICILHGYDEERVELFFNAQYSKTHKTYKIEDSLKPKPYKK